MKREIPEWQFDAMTELVWSLRWVVADAGEADEFSSKLHAFLILFDHKFLGKPLPDAEQPPSKDEG